MTPRKYLLLSVIVAAVALGACSSSSKTTSAPTTAPLPPTTRATVPKGTAATFSGPITGGMGSMVLTESVGAGSGRARVHNCGVRRGRNRVVVQGSRPAGQRRPLVRGARQAGDLPHAHRRAHSARAELQRDAARRVAERERGLRHRTRTSCTPAPRSSARDTRGSASPRRRSACGRQRSSLPVEARQERRARRGRPGPLRIAAPSRRPVLARHVHQIAARCSGRTGSIPLRWTPSPKRIIALGESQSAFELTTYIDAIQPRTRIFDGFFVYSRGGARLPLGGGDIGTGDHRRHPHPDRHRRAGVPLRDRDRRSRAALLRRPPARLATTSGCGTSRAPRTPTRSSSAGTRTCSRRFGCNGSRSTPRRRTTSSRAALDHLDHVGAHRHAAAVGAPHGGRARQRACRRCNATRQGIAIGGVRTAANDVPIAALSGVATAGHRRRLCSLFGETLPVQCRRRSPGCIRRRRTSMQKFARGDRQGDREAATCCAADRAAILAEAAKTSAGSTPRPDQRPLRPPGGS